METEVITMTRKYKPEIQQIHDEAKGAFEEILKEANKLINKDVEGKGERLDKLGFKNNPETKEGREAKKARELKELVEYYNFHYPQNKFINEERVNQICEKYNLYLGSIHNYIGFVPEFALEEMESFKLKEDDDPHVGELGINEMMAGHRFGEKITVQIIPTEMSIEHNAIERRPGEFLPGGMTCYVTGIVDGAINIVDDSSNGFQIVAPEKDFEFQNKFKVGRKLIEDPIVLQPVKGGYLIVTAWGDEAKEVANPNKN